MRACCVCTLVKLHFASPHFVYFLNKRDASQMRHLFTGQTAFMFREHSNELNKTGAMLMSSNFPPSSLSSADLGQQASQGSDPGAAQDPSAGVTQATQAQPGTYKAIIHVGTDGSVHVTVTQKGQVLCDEDTDSMDEAMEEITECLNGSEQSEGPDAEAQEASDAGESDDSDASGAGGDQSTSGGDAVPDAATMWKQEAKKRQGSSRSLIAPGSQV